MVIALKKLMSRTKSFLIEEGKGPIMQLAGGTKESESLTRNVTFLYSASHCLQDTLAKLQKKSPINPRPEEQIYEEAPNTF